MRRNGTEVGISSDIGDLTRVYQLRKYYTLSRLEVKDFSGVAPLFVQVRATTAQQASRRDLSKSPFIGLSLRPPQCRASIKIRAAQIKPAHRTTQLAPHLLQFRRTIRTKSLRMPRRSRRLLQLPGWNISFNLLPLIQAHPRNILPPTPARKWIPISP